MPGPLPGLPFVLNLRRCSIVMMLLLLGLPCLLCLPCSSALRGRARRAPRASHCSACQSVPASPQSSRQAVVGAKTGHSQVFDTVQWALLCRFGLGWGLLLRWSLFCAPSMKANSVGWRSAAALPALALPPQGGCSKVVLGSETA